MWFLIESVTICTGWAWSVEKINSKLQKPLASFTFNLSVCLSVCLSVSCLSVSLSVSLRSSCLLSFLNHPLPLLHLISLIYLTILSSIAEFPQYLPIWQPVSSTSLFLCVQCESMKSH